MNNDIHFPPHPDGRISLAEENALSRPPSQPKHWGLVGPYSMGTQVALALVIMLLGMSCFQAIKYLVNPQITLFVSNLVTVVFTSAIAAGAVYVALRKQYSLYGQAVEEVALRRHVEDELRQIQEDLEQRVLERTRELAAINHQLQEEIVERQRAEEWLKESEWRYRTLFEEAAVSITSFDQDGVVQFINKYHLKTFALNKYGPEFFVGKRITELPAIVHGGYVNEIARVLEGDTVDLKEVFCPEFSGGHSGYLNIRAVPLLKDGRMTGGILIREDVTALKRIETELRRTNRALETIGACHRALVKATSEGVLLKSICQAIVDQGYYKLAWVGFAANDENRSILVAAQAGLENGYLKYLDLTWADTEAGGGPSGRAVRTGRPVVMTDIQNNPEFARWRDRALHRGYQSTIALPLTADDRIIGVLRIYSEDAHAFDGREVEMLTGLADDVSYGLMARRMQAERQKSREDKAKLETQLRQAQKMEAIGTLAGGIAHDFNNILGAMLGYTQLALMDTKQDNKMRNYLEQVRRAGDRATDLVRQILAFSRQTESDRYPVEIGPLVKEDLKLLRASLPSTIEIQTDIRSNGAVLADPTQLHQVVVNLATNAAQAMEERGGLLKVELEEVVVEAGQNQDLGVAPGPYLCLKIGDTGMGIHPGVIDRIFEPYYTTKPAGQGTGLGLATVHGIVKSHGGIIKVYSEVGLGSTFTVFLPRIEAVLDQEQPVVSMPPGGTERVLLVDDEVPLADLGREMLRRLGYTVTVLTDSLEALKVFLNHPQEFDILFTDQTMPRMTGLELAKEVRKVRPDLPVVICTGFSAKITPQKMEAEAIQGLVHKPVLIGDLAHTMRQALDGRPSRLG